MPRLVQDSREGRRACDPHKSSYPEPSVPLPPIARASKSLYNTWHQVADDDEVAYADTETLDGDRSIEDNCCIGVRHLREGEEASCAAVEVAGATGLQVQAEPARGASP